MTLTVKQSQVLDFIGRFIRQSGFPPTRQEIADGFRFRSGNTVEHYLDTLEAKGQLRRIKGQSRGIVLTDLALADPHSAHLSDLPDGWTCMSINGFAIGGTDKALDEVRRVRAALEEYVRLDRLGLVKREDLADAS